MASDGVNKFTVRFHEAIAFLQGAA